MSHPERRHGDIIIPWVEFHSSQVCSALSLTYRKLDRWIDLGLVDVDSFRQKTRIPFQGTGSVRVYHYPDILQLALTRELHRYQNKMDDIKQQLSCPPENSSSWGELIAQCNPTSAGNIFYAAFAEAPGDPLDVITDEEELLGAVASSLSGFYVNLAGLKNETDEGIMRVLSAGC